MHGEEQRTLELENGQRVAYALRLHPADAHLFDANAVLQPRSALNTAKLVTRYLSEGRIEDASLLRQVRERVPDLDPGKLRADSDLVLWAAREKDALIAELATAGVPVPSRIQLIDEIQQHVRGRLAPYEYPREIEFLEALPMTTTGKVQRKELRKREGG